MADTTSILAAPRDTQPGAVARDVNLELTGEVPIVSFAAACKHDQDECHSCDGNQNSCALFAPPPSGPPWFLDEFFPGVASPGVSGERMSGDVHVGTSVLLQLPHPALLLIDFRCLAYKMGESHQRQFSKLASTRLEGICCLTVATVHCYR